MPYIKKLKILKWSFCILNGFLIALCINLSSDSLVALTQICIVALYLSSFAQGWICKKFYSEEEKIKRNEAFQKSYKKRYFVTKNKTKQ